VNSVRLKLCLAILALIATVGFTIPSEASLIGDHISAEGYSLSPGDATIGSGVEFTGIDGHLSFDFGASSLTINSSDVSGWFGYSTYTFSGFDAPIVDVDIALNDGYSGDWLENFTFGENSITLDMSSGFAFYMPGVPFSPYSSRVVFNIVTKQVDEPSVLALLGVSLLGLLALRKT
jgi:hypothetical protein